MCIRDSLTGATQNVKDLLSPSEFENILDNSDFITLLNQASGDRKILSEQMCIRDSAYAALVRQYKMEQEVKAIVQKNDTPLNRKAQKAHLRPPFCPNFPRTLKCR